MTAKAVTSVTLKGDGDRSMLGCGCGRSSFRPCLLSAPLPRTTAELHSHPEYLFQLASSEKKAPSPMEVRSRGIKYNPPDIEKSDAADAAAHPDMTIRT